MITANIDINKNKLEEFVRVLLPEYYEILSENTDKKGISTKRKIGKITYEVVVHFNENATETI